MSFDPESAETTGASLAIPRSPSALDQKILEHFPGMVVRKDLTNGLDRSISQVDAGTQ
jgi:predicted ATP-dependent Lon-type protease